MLNKHDTIGIDLVAMCVNDLIVQGAEPLFFLDYYATGSLNPDVAISVISGIGEGCRQSGCSLIGGETAEMPGMYKGEEYDLAGFCVGIVEKDKIIDGSKVSSGNHIIALGSSGPHANGYSLIRKVLEKTKPTSSQLKELRSVELHSPQLTRDKRKFPAEISQIASRLLLSPMLVAINPFVVFCFCVLFVHFIFIKD